MQEEPMRCSMTGIPIRDCSDGIWDDGEWISWDYINRQIAIQEGELDPAEEVRLFRSQPKGEALLDLIDLAVLDEESGESPSPRWGNIGELYIAERYGVVLSREHAQGHDGRLGNDLVEIKTLTPNKHRPVVRVKRKGNFSLLAVVRVNEYHEFAALLVRRDKLPMAGEGEWLFIDWNTLRSLAEPFD